MSDTQSNLDGSFNSIDRYLLLQNAPIKSYSLLYSSSKNDRYSRISSFEKQIPIEYLTPAKPISTFDVQNNFSLDKIKLNENTELPDSVDKKKLKSVDFKAIQANICQNNASKKNKHIIINGFIDIDKLNKETIHQLITIPSYKLVNNVTCVQERKELNLKRKFKLRKTVNKNKKL